MKKNQLIPSHLQDQLVCTKGSFSTLQIPPSRSDPRLEQRCALLDRTVPSGHHVPGSNAPRQISGTAELLHWGHVKDHRQDVSSNAVVMVRKLHLQMVE